MSRSGVTQVEERRDGEIKLRREREVIRSMHGGRGEREREGE